ncbi:patatin-like phospholipase family protein [uncultured Sphaerochaeta sp.]|uniref:patatin-like phospholipase family protein n=1 Tax=uncultured Sphaerochaeta sp. TaxID=886478 RepID=UPI002A0A4DA3|nr:patatin-like phospholipase family protein [uncultured Sphaerochaeta sp.]
MRRIVVLALLVLLSLPLSATTEKVALVLSGGGARGLAHIAVLEAVEARGIPIDMVVGTSMGALVGGLYSAGYSPLEIRNLLETYDMVGLFSTPPLEDAEHEDEVFSYKNNQVFSLGFGEQGLGNAPALIGDQRILELLGYLFARYPNTMDFSELPIPFYCVSANAATGERIVHSEGSLVTAIRSSISIPIVFTPFPLGEGILAIDGGVVDNLPIDLARSLGAEYVIASDVNALGMQDAADLESLSAMAMQTVVLLTQEKATAQHPSADVLVLPELKSTFALDFSAHEQIIEAGWEAVRKEEAAFDALVDTLSQVRPLTPVEENRSGTYSLLSIPKILQIEVEDISLKPGEIIPESFLFSDFLGRRLDAQTATELNLKLREVKNAYDLTTLSYEMSSDGKLMIYARSFGRRDRSISMGFHADTGFSTALPSGFVWYRADAYLDASLGGLGRKQDFTFSVNATLGQRSGMTLSFSYPLLSGSKGSIDAVVQASYGAGAMTPLSAMINAKRSAPLDRMFESDAGFRFRFGKYGRASLQGSYLLVSVNDSTYDKQFYAYPVGELTVSYGNLSSRFATSGFSLEVLGRLGYQQGLIHSLRIGWKQSFVITYRDSLSYATQLSLMREPFPFIQSYANLGGIDQMVSYGPLFLRRDIAYLGVDWQHRLAELLGYPAFGKLSLHGAVYDAYDPYSGLAPLDEAYFSSSLWDMGLALMLGLDTPIGEVMASFGASLMGEVSFSLGVY